MEEIFSNRGLTHFTALIATASGEYFREALRKPLVISQWMYSNGVRLVDVPQINQEGYLTRSMWTATGGQGAIAVAHADGQAIFRDQCMSCHTIDGYRSMKALLQNRNRDAIKNLLMALHEYKEDSLYRSFMPQLAGKPEEIDALADYLNAMIHPDKPATPSVAKAQ